MEHQDHIIYMQILYYTLSCCSIRAYLTWIKSKQWFLRKICQFWKSNPQRTSAVVTICDDDDHDSKIWHSWSSPSLWWIWSIRSSWWCWSSLKVSMIMVVMIYILWWRSSVSVTKSDQFLSARADRQKHKARRLWPSDDAGGVEDDDDSDDADHLSRSPPWL